MELQEKLNYCKICTNRKMDLKTGLVCGLTNEKPAFETECPDFNVDQKEVERYQQRDQEVAEHSEDGGYFAVEKQGIKKGMLGGIIMIVIAVVWFFGGLAAGYIFYYPPILLLIGLYAVIKGAIQGNVAGKKKE